MVSSLKVTLVTSWKLSFSTHVERILRLLIIMNKFSSAGDALVPQDCRQAGQDQLRQLGDQEHHQGRDPGSHDQHVGEIPTLRSAAEVTCLNFLDLSHFRRLKD